MKLKILHLFGDLLDQYFDSGNIICMEKRLKWRGIDCETEVYTVNSDKLSLSDTDIILLGGGGDREQKYVCNYLLKYRDEIKSYIDDGGSLLAICGGYQLLGNYYQLENETIEGLKILDICTKLGEGRLIGDVILKTDFLGDSLIAGFENHGGRTYIGSHKPLGRVLYGNGNADNSGADGVLYKNIIATYLHGPLLPKNPVLCDYMLTGALKRKYGDFKELEPLDDTLENMANKYIVNRYIKK